MPCAQHFVASGVVRIMKRGCLLLACLLSSLVFDNSPGGTVALADSPNPYQQILASNVFRLRMTDPAPTMASPPAQLPRFILTGITTIGPKRVLLRVRFPATAADPGYEHSLILAEGQRDGQIEVLAIDPVAGSVRLMVCGFEMTVTFEKNSPGIERSPPLPRVTLTGISSTSHGRAILKVQPAEDERQTSEDHLCNLAPGEPDGPIEVLAIDMAAGKVRIRVYGQETVLTFQRQPVSRLTLARSYCGRIGTGSGFLPQASRRVSARLGKGFTNSAARVRVIGRLLATRASSAHRGVSPAVRRWRR